jgi:hypothetical protein
VMMIMNQALTCANMTLLISVFVVVGPILLSFFPDLNDQSADNSFEPTMRSGQPLLCLSHSLGSS